MKNMPLSQFLIVSDMGGFFFALLGKELLAIEISSSFH